MLLNSVNLYILIPMFLEGRQKLMQFHPSPRKFSFIFLLFFIKIDSSSSTSSLHVAGCVFSGAIELLLSGCYVEFGAAECCSVVVLKIKNKYNAICSDYPSFASPRVCMQIFLIQHIAPAQLSAHWNRISIQQHKLTHESHEFDGSFCR